MIYRPPWRPRRFPLKPLLFSLVLAVVGIATPALAQQPATPQAKAAGWRAADKNADGVLDKSEWLAAGRRERGFAFMDANKDGKLTREEIQAGRQRMRQMPSGGSAN